MYHYRRDSGPKGIAKADHIPVEWWNFQTEDITGRADPTKRRGASEEVGECWRWRCKERQKLRQGKEKMIFHDVTFFWVGLSGSIIWFHQTTTKTSISLKTSNKLCKSCMFGPGKMHTLFPSPTNPFMLNALDTFGNCQRSGPNFIALLTGWFCAYCAISVS